MQTDSATAPLCESQFKYPLISMSYKELELNLMNMKMVQTHGYYRGCLHLQKHELIQLTIMVLVHPFMRVNTRSIKYANFGSSFLHIK